jgi:hypothetical protein
MLAPKPTRQENSQSAPSEPDDGHLFRLLNLFPSTHSFYHTSFWATSLFPTTPSFSCVTLNDLRSHTQTHVKKILLEINFTYFGNKKIYCIFKTCCIISVYFPHNDIYFVISRFSVQIMFAVSINHAIKFKYQPRCLKVN